VRRIVQVRERTLETPSTVTLRYEDPVAAAPGQFCMIWVPGDDELPMSLSYVGDSKGVTVKGMGATSRRFLQIQEGARLGIRGPYGRGFDLSPGRILVVGGGSGTAVLAPAAEAARARGSEVDVALGGTTSAELLFANRLRPIARRLSVATDDGSEGFHGFVTGLLPDWLEQERFDAIWTCGPELMMRKVVEAGAAAQVPVFGSVERHMKCAVGLCDACALGPYHVCLDGPVFPGPTLASLPEFGRSKRDPSGLRVPL
jgi:dihydroorotate dehydrogenase electron transfer subunit